MRDLTKNYDYEKLVEEEKEHYSQIEVTDDLKEGGVHASSCWHYYWERVGRAIQASEFCDIAGYLSRTYADRQRSLEVLSLGSGYCGHELALARRLGRNYKIRCTDINEALFERAKATANQEGLALEFGVADLNFISIEPKRYDMIFAHAVLHHVINLEHLFEQLVGGLADGGIFHVADVVGMNRRLLWEESEQLVNALLGAIPKRITRGLRVVVHEEEGGMEGIRQAEIIPHLRQHFSRLYEHRHGAFMRFICTNAALASRFDPRDEEARKYLDFLIDTDDCAVRAGILQPLELWGVYQPRNRAE